MSTVFNADRGSSLAIRNAHTTELDDRIVGTVTFYPDATRVGNGGWPVGRCGDRPAYHRQYVRRSEHVRADGISAGATARLLADSGFHRDGLPAGSQAVTARNVFSRMRGEQFFGSEDDQPGHGCAAAGDRHILGGDLTAVGEHGSPLGIPHQLHCATAPGGSDAELLMGNVDVPR